MHARPDSLPPMDAQQQATPAADDTAAQPGPDGPPDTDRSAEPESDADRSAAPDADRSLEPDADRSAEAEPGGPGLSQPLRWLVAAAEVLAAAALVVLAVWAWRRSTIPVELPQYDNPAIPAYSSRQSGPMVALAVGAALACGVLLLDAAREALLAVRGRR